MQSAELRNIPVAQIRCEDMTCSVWAFSDYAKVKESVACAGIRTPPVLVQKESGQFCIVAGQKRIRSAIDLGFTDTACFVFPATSEILKLFIGAVWENLSFRNYNLVEKAMMIKRMDELHLEEAQKDKILTRLSISKHQLPLMRGLLNLPQESLKAIASETLSPSLVDKFAELNPADQNAFLRLLRISAFNGNKQNEIFRILQDLCKIENISFSELLENKEIGEIENNPAWNNPQKGLHLRLYLHHRRFPALAIAEKKFEGLKSKLNFPRNMKVESAPPFENDRFGLRLELKNVSELKKAADFLLKKSEDDDMEQLIRLSKGLL
jgi:hypothetical protein